MIRLTKVGFEGADKPLVLSPTWVPRGRIALMNEIMLGDKTVTQLWLGDQVWLTVKETTGEIINASDDIRGSKPRSNKPRKAPTANARPRSSRAR